LLLLNLLNCKILGLALMNTFMHNIHDFIMCFVLS